MDDCEEIVIQLCANCGMTLTNRDIVRAHHTGPTYNNRRAIIVKFIHYQDKVRILKAKPAFREAGVTVVEDFPVEVLTKRKVFKPILQAAFNSNGKYKERLLMDKLIVNGQYYSVSDIDKLPADLNPKHLATVKQENITAFFTEHSPLSNHHPCSLSVEDQHFTSVEQFFMKCKASHFQDHNKVQEIMNNTNPKRAKALGRQIQNFDASSWHSVCDEYMKKGLSAKFRQNPSLAKYLKDTGITVLVEANPHDTYWGVGLSLTSMDIWNPEKWRGKNTLGVLLQQIRDVL